jgi:hypothetical protein
VLVDFVYYHALELFLMKLSQVFDYDVVERFVVADNFVAFVVDVVVLQLMLTFVDDFVAVLVVVDDFVAVLVVVDIVVVDVEEVVDNVAVDVEEVVDNVVVVVDNVVVEHDIVVVVEHYFHDIVEFHLDVELDNDPN